MNRLAVSLSLVATLGLSTSVQAHFFAESHDCRAPVKPQQFFTEEQRQAFDHEVDLYRACLQEFVDKQNESVQKHQGAAQKAADAWSNYAQNVLGSEVKAANQ